MSVEASTQNEVSDFKRPFSAKFDPDIWGNSFLQYASESMKVEDEMEVKRFQQLQEEVKKTFASFNNHNNLSQKLNFIDTVQRLGVAYHFEREIEEALAKIHSICTNNTIIITENYDLCSLALLFRLLRQQGYPISSDVFNKFKNENGTLDETIAIDVEGMLALYEAAELRVHGEDILEEALRLTSTHLKDHVNNNQLSPSLAAQANHRLSQPLHKRMPRIEARHYMSFYEQDASYSRNLLTFAKLDYNMLQRLHQKEIGNMTKWWNKLDHATKIPYARDRMVECYFWSSSMSWEPQHSTSRTQLGKLDAVLTSVDDTFDSYATSEELELFTEAIHRWDISPIKSLPEYMQVVFEALVEMYGEIESETTKSGTSFVMPYFKRCIDDLSHAYLVEAKWRDKGHIPTYDEYKVNGAVTSTAQLQLTFFCGLGKYATKEVLDFISLDSKIIRAVSLILRLVDDIASHKFEQERKHVASAVECCMKQYGISSEEACKIIYNDILDCWKDINETCLKPHVVSKPVLDFVMNLARMAEVTYEDFNDGFTSPEFLKHHLVTLLADPMSIED